jgi:PucR-like helix-turn-helix protein/diguanylate cyclase with GGDEF domain
VGSASSPVASDAVSAAASELVGRIDTIADEVAVAISTALPPLAYDESLIASNCANLELGFRMLRDGVPGEMAMSPPAARSYAREISRRVGDVDPLLAAYRLGCSSFWREWSSAIAARVSEPRDLLVAMDDSAAFMLGYHASLARQIAEEFAAGREEAARRTGKAQLVREILAGRVTDEVAVSHALRYPLHLHHLGIVVQTDGNSGLRPVVEALAGEVAEAAGADATLVVADDTVGSIWLGRRRSLRVEHAADAAAALARETASRVGVGEQGRGCEGFRLTHLEAREALRVGTLGERPRLRLTRYGDVALESLLSVDDERAWRFVERTLGGLAGPDDGALRLRATLRIFFEEGLNQARTARRLRLHHNTVAYRIRRAEELLGYPIAGRRLELEAALTLAEAFGERRDDTPDATAPRTS